MIMQRRSLLLVLVVLVSVPRITVGVQRCYSTSCSSSYHVCIRLCQTDEHYCHIRFSPDRINQLLAADLGCGNISHDQSLLSMSVVPDIHYSCEGDLCNYVDYLAHSLQPLLDIPLNLPKNPPPHPHQGYQVCERYHCSSGDCIADYEFCFVALPTMGYCQAVYIVSATTMKVKLLSKGCQTVSGNLLGITTECHIDNHLDSPAGAILECTCNGNLCNQEITFTNPTRHAQYGASVCQQLNCSHQCEIVHNKPICRCPNGYHDVELDGHTCEDINECSIYHGGCTYFCINTPGSYHCDCTSDRYLSVDGRTCKIKEGLVCKGQRCVGNQCSITSDQYCFDTVSEDQQGGTTYCAAEYTYNGTTWTPNWKQCWNSIKSNFSCIDENRCVLDRTLKHQNQSVYTCCCKSDHCNSDNMVNFPFGQPPSPTTISSSSMVAPTVTTVFSFTIQPEPLQSISTPVFVAFVVASTGWITILSILTSLWLWYLYRKCWSMQEQDMNEPRNALEEEEEEDPFSHRGGIQDQLEITHSDLRPRLTTSSSNAIEMNKVSMTDDAFGQDVTEHVTSL